MANIICPECEGLIYIPIDAERAFWEYDGPMKCYHCGGTIHLVIEKKEVKKVEKSR